jgi:5,10-methylenetetrahydromethanopterin reductase
MGLTIEAEITPGMNAKEVTQLAAIVEEVGFDRLGISDVPLYPDSFQIQTACALATKRIRIGSLVTNPYTRHPAVLAGAVATLQDISEGRAFLGLGVGAGLEPLGVIPSRPVSTLRESVHIIRELLAGHTVTYHGRIFNVTKAKLTLVPVQPIPILIGTRSPQTMKLAGEMADIAVVGARYLSKQTAQTYRSWIAEGAERVGRKLLDIEVAPRITLCVSHNGELARKSVKLYAAYYLVLLKPKDMPIVADRLARIEEIVQRVTDWYFSPHLRYPEELDAVVTDDIVDRFAVAGTPQECARKIQRIVDLGFTSVSMNLAAVRRGSMYEGLQETITSFGEVIPEIKRF